ncbi:MAG UNVERIFIED_CONTAM: TerB family tellurite resistance protein, partial [Thermobifida fusca]
FLQRLVARLPRVDDEHADAYLDLLDRAVIDRHISVTEALGLAAFAREVGLGREQVVELHERYLEALAAAALADGVVTDAERADLARVTAMLGLDGSQLYRALTRAADGERPVRPGLGQFRLAPGDEVVFTGQLDVPRQVWEERAVDTGLRPAASVTRRTRLLVAADPDSQSGKARRARQIGVPIVDSETFLRLCRQVRTDGVNVS